MIDLVSKPINENHHFLTNSNNVCNYSCRQLQPELETFTEASVTQPSPQTHPHSYSLHVIQTIFSSTYIIPPSISSTLFLRVNW